MINQRDYDEGWTTPIFDAATGRWLHGGAARNRRLALSGGVAQVNVSVAVAAINSIEPIFRAMMEQLRVQAAAIQALSSQVADLRRSRDLRD